MANDPRTLRIWKRLTQCYGTRFTDTYGKVPTEPWIDAVDALSDEQIAYGVKVVMRESPVHPPALGQFINACSNMPIAQAALGPTIQEQLCEYAALHVHDRAVAGDGMTLKDYSLPWTYVYREWWEATRPKGMERCAECIGLVIELPGGKRIGWSVAAMLGDEEGHARVLRNFRPGPLPTEAQIRAYHGILPPPERP